jgi:hypothetical protein
MAAHQMRHNLGVQKPMELLTPAFYQGQVNKGNVKFAKYIADVRTDIEYLRNAAPTYNEERH